MSASSFRHSPFASRNACQPENQLVDPALGRHMRQQVARRVNGWGEEDQSPEFGCRGSGVTAHELPEESLVLGPREGAAERLRTKRMDMHMCMDRVCWLSCYGGSASWESKQVSKYVSE